MKLLDQYRLELLYPSGNMEHASFFVYESGVWIESEDWDRKLYTIKRAREIYASLLKQGFRKYNW